MTASSMDDVGHAVRYDSPMGRHGQDIRCSSRFVERARAILREQLFIELPPHSNGESVGACLKGRSSRWSGQQHHDR
jgi:hypothetical protein